MREATVRVPDAALDDAGLRAVVERCREAGLRSLRELSCHGGGALVAVEVERPIPPAAFEEMAAVQWVERLDAEAPVYLLDIDAPGLPEAMAPCSGDGLSNRSTDVTADGVEMTVVGNQDVLAERLAAFDDAGLGLDIRRLGDYDGPSTPLDALTARQREVLAAAWDAGYYDVPRTATVEAVAETLGVDPSTATEHIQRAERNLLAELLDSPTGSGAGGRQ
jgi:hypothetical protein